MAELHERAREILAQQYENGNYVARASTIRDGTNVPWLETEFVLPAMIQFRREALEEVLEVSKAGTPDPWEAAFRLLTNLPLPSNVK